MKKIALTSLFILILSFLGQAQCYWTQTSSNDLYYTSGRVAINTTTYPNHPHIKLLVNGSQLIYGTSASLYFGGATNTPAGYGNYGIEYNESEGGLNFWRPFGSKSQNWILFLKDNGSIGIGTKDLSSGYKLTVAGGIHAREVLVTETAGGADFVFDKSYKLRPLSEVDAFINKNKHLPEIQSAQDMQINGINIAEFQIKLLQKIEELTLYIIEQQKEINELKKTNIK